LEAVGKGLEIVEGSSQAAGTAMERIKKIAKAPGLGLQEAATGYTNMRALGFAAEFTEKALLAVGNAVAIGGKGKWEFNNIITQLNQMASKPKVLMEDLKPILNSAPMIAMKVKEIYGTIDASEINEQLTGGTKEFLETLVEELSKVPSAASGAKNAIENFGDSLIIAGANIGETINESSGLTGAINNLGDTIISGSEYFKNMNATTKDATVLIAGLAVAFGPLSYGVGVVVTKLPALVMGLNAAKFATGGLVTVLAGAALLYADHQRHLNDMVKATESVEDINKRISVQYYNEIRNVQDLIEVLRDEKSSKEQILKAKEDLLKIDPQFSTALKGENINFVALNDQVSKYISNLTAAAKVKVLQSKIESNVAMEQKILEDPSSNLDTFEKLQKGAAMIMLSMQKKQEQVYESIAVKNAQDIIKLRYANKQYEDEVKKIIEAGYVPEANTAKPAGGKGAGGGLLPGGVNKDFEKDLKDELAFKLEMLDSMNEYFRQQEAVIKGSSFGGLNIGTLDKIDVEKKEKEFEEIASIYLGQNFKIDKTGTQSKLKDRGKMLIEQSMKEMQELADQKEAKMMDFKQRNADALNADITHVLFDFGEDLVSGAGFGNAFVGLLNNMGNALINFGKQALIAEEAIKLIKASFGTGPGAALSAIGIGLGIKLVGQQMNVPKLAQGGMVTGPTTVVVGDNRSGKEAVIPFEKMGAFLEMAGFGGKSEGVLSYQRLRGKNIDLITKRQKRTYK
jgi:tape measure domain-containing protein